MRYTIAIGLVVAGLWLALRWTLSASEGGLGLLVVLEEGRQLDEKREQRRVFAESLRATVRALLTQEIGLREAVGLLREDTGEYAADLKQKLRVAVGDAPPEQLFGLVLMNHLALFPGDEVADEVRHEFEEWDLTPAVRRCMRDMDEGRSPASPASASPRKGGSLDHS